MYQDQVPTGHGTEANTFKLCLSKSLWSIVLSKKKKSSYNSKQLETAAKQRTFTA